MYFWTQAFLPRQWYCHENANTLIGAAILKLGHPYIWDMLPRAHNIIVRHLTNQIAPFEGNNVGYCMCIYHLWQRVTTQDNNFASFWMQSMCVCSAVQSVAQLSWWISMTEKICVMDYSISHLLHYTTRAITDIIDHGKSGCYYPHVSAITNTYV